MPSEYGVAKLFGSALIGAVLAVLGIKKLIKGEICEGLKPKIADIHKDIANVKIVADGALSEEKHKLICKLTSDLVDQRITSIHDLINTRFDALDSRLDRRRADNGEG